MKLLVQVKATPTAEPITIDLGNTPTLEEVAKQVQQASGVDLSQVTLKTPSGAAVDISAFAPTVALEFPRSDHSPLRGADSGSATSKSAPPPLPADMAVVAVTAPAAEACAVVCSEGQVQCASPTDGFDFGDVTSCMTLTCLLDDGSMVAAHEGVYERVEGGAIQALQELIAQRDATVTRVIAVGAPGLWTPDLRSQADVAADVLTPDMDFWQQQEALMSRMVASREDGEDEFKARLQKAFGLSDIASVSFATQDEGRVQVNADGSVTLG